MYVGPTYNYLDTHVHVSMRVCIYNGGHGGLSRACYTAAYTYTQVCC